MKPKLQYRNLLLLLLLGLASGISAQSVTWTQYADASRPNILGLDDKAGAKNIAYNPSNGDVYAFGSSTFGLPAVPSGLAWGKELTVRRYDNLTGTLVNSITLTHHTSADTIPYSDEPGEMLIASDGSVYLTARYFFNSYWGYDMLVIKLNSSLVEQWRYYLYGVTNSNDWGTGITEDADGKICVTGMIGNSGSGTGSDVVVAKFDPVNSIIWQRTYSIGAAYNDTPTDITTDNNRNIYVCGYSGSASNGDQFMLLKYNSNGDFKFRKTFGRIPGVFNDRANSIACDKALGRVYVTGTAWNSSGNTDVATLAYDTTGTRLWTKYINSLSGNSEDRGFKVIVGPSNRVYVSGDLDRQSSASRESDLFHKIYDSAGNVIRTRKYNGALYKCSFGDMAVSSTGTVYLTGSCTGAVPPPGFGTSYLTVKYNSSGTFQWADIVSPSQFQTCGEGYYGWSLAVNTSTSEVAVSGRHFVDCPGANTEEWMVRRIGSTLRVGEEDVQEESSPDKDVLSFSLFPNPASELIKISIRNKPEDNLMLNIYDLQGKLVDNREIIQQEETIDISRLPSGIYVIELIGEDAGNRMKFIKQ